MDARGLKPALIVLLVGVVSITTAYDLTIMHTNDVHSRFDEANTYGGLCSPSDSLKGKCVGGVSRRATKIKEIRYANPNSLLLDGGDQFQGTFWFNVYKGVASAVFMKLLGYDAMAIGNHEFDMGLPVLQNFINNVTSGAGAFDVVNSNIDNSNEPRLIGYKKYVIKTVGGRKIGIVGFTTEETPEIVTKGNTGNLAFRDIVSSVRESVNALRAANPDVNIIIAIGHGGFDVDQRIAKEVDYVDVVVGGHTNTFLYTGAPPSVEVPQGEYPFRVTKNQGGKTALCVQAFYFSKYLGNLKVSFDDAGEVTSWGGNPILLDKSVPKDAEMEAVLEPYKSEINAWGGKKIGQSAAFLQGDTTFCRNEECNMANLITDAWVHYFRDEETPSRWSTGPIGIINGGAVRVPIAKGNITTANLLTTMPFGNTVVLLKLKGSTILKAFERSVEAYDPVVSSGAFLQVSGVQVKYDLKKPAGQRVVDLKLRCGDCDYPRYEPLNSTRIYDVVTSSFLASGQEGYSMLLTERVGIEIRELSETDLVMDYLSMYDVVYPAAEGRIQFVETQAPKCPTAPPTTTTAAPRSLPCFCGPYSPPCRLPNLLQNIFGH